MRTPARGPPSWLRLPRRTARLRLTVLYGAAFLVCGAAVLAILPTCSTGTRHARIPPADEQPAVVTSRRRSPSGPSKVARPRPVFRR